MGGSPASTRPAKRRCRRGLAGRQRRADQLGGAPLIAHLGERIQCPMDSSSKQQQQNASVCRFKRVPVASDGSAQCGGIRGGQRCGVVNADLAVSVVASDVV